MDYLQFLSIKHTSGETQASREYTHLKMDYSQFLSIKQDTVCAHMCIADFCCWRHGAVFGLSSLLAGQHRTCVVAFKAEPWFLTSLGRVAMGTVALCVPEGTKGDCHQRTSERAWCPIGTGSQNSTFDVIAKAKFHSCFTCLLPANTSLSACYCHSLGTGARTTGRLFRARQGSPVKSKGQGFESCLLSSESQMTAVSRKFQFLLSFFFFFKSQGMCKTNFKVYEQSVRQQSDFPNSCPKPKLAKLRHLANGYRPPS